ncbi:hypothetical protein VOLCADRAFT_98019 [Volvox carteri f. nagariensis]|uniref:F-box domain-containing protein n=1 Tax=Volvox carteri f. nagariensis TaxID=3068 RepID=D8UE85_VOLCA|nr:uncharacterized protein VOLCADRAFT_98019 [Volvox carteri f. nagariensis]EFJ41962.1 hypothetical protein VOLCADRAFT_98019 [Volvox carteri f. nagariensis]|eukprot:XP_002956999.1 hypothetical protein VOLCADRAFT_98019 [Volvox carteri f. nagariensis]
MVLLRLARSFLLLLSPARRQDPHLSSEHEQIENQINDQHQLEDSSRLSSSSSSSSGLSSGHPKSANFFGAGTGAPGNKKNKNHSGGSGTSRAPLTSLPQPLLQSILISAAGSAGGAVRSCRALRDAWRSALSDPVLAAKFLVNRHGRGAAAIYAYSGSFGGGGGDDSGGGGGTIFRALLRGLPLERHDEAALAFVRALASEGAVGLVATAAAAPLPLPPSPTGGQQLHPLLVPLPPLQPPLQHQEPLPQLEAPPPPLQPQQLPPPPLPPAPVQEPYQLRALLGGGGGGGDDGQEALVALLRGAARANHAAVVRELVNAGAPTLAVVAAMQAACWCGNEPLVRQLLQAVGLVRNGIDGVVAPEHLHDTNAAELTAAAAAAATWTAAEHWSEADARLLLAPPLAAASQGRTPRHVAVLELLLAAGADPRVSGSEALVRACAAGGTAAIRLLLRAGADPRASRCRPLVAAAEVLRVRATAQLIATGSYSYSDLSAAARELLVPPLVSRCASLAALLLPWLTVGALLLTASAPVVFACVLLCLWNGLWVVSALSVVGYGLGLALAAAAVGLAAGMALAAWATSTALLLQFLVRALLRRSAMDGAAAAAAAAAAATAAAAAAAGQAAAAAAAAAPTADL